MLLSERLVLPEQELFSFFLPEQESLSAFLPEQESLSAFFLPEQESLSLSAFLPEQLALSAEGVELLIGAAWVATVPAAKIPASAAANTVD